MCKKRICLNFTAMGMKYCDVFSIEDDILEHFIRSPTDSSLCAQCTPVNQIDGRFRHQFYEIHRQIIAEQANLEVEILSSRAVIRARAFADECSQASLPPFLHTKSCQKLNRE